MTNDTPAVRGTSPDGLPEVPPASGPVINATPAGAADGVNRCSRCGATEVQWLPEKGTYRCEFCRFEWSGELLDEAMGLSEGIDKLEGTVLSSASVDIADDSALVTMKCQGCGAEVVIDTNHNLQARCHWCKHVLSINNVIPNGAVPDGILPFLVTKEQAMHSIQSFYDQRKRFASPAFAASFKPENIMGVYMPYMTVDGNVSVRLDGEGEIQTRIVRSDKSATYYADRFQVMRQVGLLIDDLIVETSSDKANIQSVTSTTNIINAVLPFDVKNIVRFNANYLGSEFTSERRDMDVSHADDYAYNHMMTIARGAVLPSIAKYNRGVKWDAEQVAVKGTRWTAVLLPVWLYGYVEKKNGREITHYIAVNGRTGATMGSVPINTKKAALVCWATAIGISIFTWPLAIAVLWFGS